MPISITSTNMAATRIARGALNLLNFRLIPPVLVSKCTNIRRIHTTWLLGSERKFTKDHEWIVMSTNIGTIGISDHAQSLLGDIVYVELPEVGKIIEQNEVFGVVESVKAASDLYSPVSGEIIEANEMLNEQPELVNQEPYDGGWIAKVNVTDMNELDGLMDEAAYNEYVKDSEDE